MTEVSDALRVCDDLHVEVEGKESVRGVSLARRAGEGIGLVQVPG